LDLREREKVGGRNCRKSRSQDLHNCHSSPFIMVTKSRRIRCAGHVSRMGKMRNAYNILIGKSEGKRPLGRPRLRWRDNIRMDLREIGRGLDSIKGWEYLD